MVTRLACVAVLCGFLYGYNEAVVGGAYDLLEAYFVFPPYWRGILVAALPLGGLVGAFLCAHLSDAYGRRSALIISGLLFVLGSLLSGLALELYLLSCARLLVGIAIGISSLAALQYLAEISPPKARGRLLAAFQLLVSLGILSAYLSEALINRVPLTGDPFNHWQLLYLMSGIAAVAMLAGSLASLESPRWLAMVGKAGHAEATFIKLEPTQTPDWAIRQVKLLRQDAIATQEKRGWRELLSANMRPITGFALMCFLLQQLSGVYVLLFYAPSILEEFGLPESSVHTLTTLGFAAALILGSALSVFLIDRIGRRPLMVMGYPCCAATLLLIIWGMDMPAPDGIWITLTGIFLFVVNFAFSIGPLPWVYMAELFPSHLRAKGMALAVSLNWILTFLAVFAFPKIYQFVSVNQILLFFVVTSFFGAVYMVRKAPETNTLTLENIQQLFKKHQ